MAGTDDNSIETSSSIDGRDQDGPVLDTILARGNMESVGKEALKLYFNNTKKCGGEGIVNILIQQDKTFITFNDVQGIYVNIMCVAIHDPYIVCMWLLCVTTKTC